MMRREREREGERGGGRGKERKTPGKIFEKLTEEIFKEVPKRNSCTKMFKTHLYKASFLRFGLFDDFCLFFWFN